MFGQVLLITACGWFNSDPVARLEADVFSGPATTLSVAGLDAPPEVPGLRPGELAPLTVLPEGPLVPLAVAPQGADRDPSQVAVVFNRPMVALTDIDTAAAKVPVSCSPHLDGRARWAGTSTAVLIPEGGRFPLGTEYTCSIPAGTAALDGAALASDVEWSFSTLRPALVRSRPGAGADDWDPKAPIVLKFNQPMDPARVQSDLRLRAVGRADVPARVKRGTDDLDKPEIVVVEASLTPDTAYEIVLADGMRGADGPLGLAGETVVPFRTYGPLTLSQARPVGDAVDPESPIELTFSTAVTASTANARVHLSPAPPDGWKPDSSYDSPYWSVWTRLAPRTTYTVTVDAGITDTHGQTLAQGSVWSFTTGDLRPFVDGPDGMQLYPASNPTSLGIRHRNLSSLDVIAERVDPLAFALDPESLHGWRGDFGPAATRQRYEGGGRDNRTHLAQVDLTPSLVSGFGLVHVLATAPEVAGPSRGSPSEALLQVTDLGASLKLAGDSASVWVTRLSDGQPVEGATVRLVHAGRVAWTGSTGVDGLAVAEGDVVPDDWRSWREPLWVLVEKGADASLTAHAWDEGMRAWDFQHSGWFEAAQDQPEAFAFTDRGVYKRGETAHAQFLFRRRTLDGLAAPTDREVSWTFSDPNGVQISEGLGELDANGAWTTSVPLPPQATPGDYELRVKAAGTERSVWFPIRSYRAPSFRVDVAAPPSLMGATPLEATVQARYLFGSPMKGADVRWTIWRSPLTLAPEGWEAFSFAPLPDPGEWETASDGYSTVSNGTGRIDAGGALAVRQDIPAGDLSRPWTYHVEATVTDVDRQQLSNRASVDVHSAEAYAAVRALTSVVTAGQVVRAEAALVAPDGAARGGAVTLRAYRRTWDTIRERGMDGTYRWVSTPRDAQVAEGTAQAGGRAAEWSFTPSEGGYYLIRAEGRDAAGRTSTAEADVWVAGTDVSWARTDSRALALVPDKARYRPGDTATVLVRAPRAGMRALVTVERDGVWSREVVTLRTTSDTLKIPITERHLPNAFVSVLAVEGAGAPGTPDAGKPGVWYGLANLRVDASGARLDVDVQTDRTSYAPGDDVSVSLTVTRDGKAVPNARLTLWAVDHGVLSLTAYETPDPHGTFHAERGLATLTADNRIAVYDRAAFLAKGAEVGGGGGKADDVRGRFETTPLWTSGLRTGPDGKVQHRFTLPDNLTTFRVMAVADDARAGFGAGDADLRVNRPLIVRPALPRFFRSNDRALAGVVLHNNTDQELSVEVQATATGATLRGAPRTVKVAAGAATEVPFALLDFTSHEVAFRFEAMSGTLKDAVDWKVPVMAALPQEVVATSGSTTGSVTETLTVPAEARKDVGGLTVNASASALVGLGAALDYLVEYPHGCLEQTGSGLRVAMLARRLGERAGVTTPPEALDGFIRDGLSSLNAFRTADGGFAYWKGDARSYGPASAYALEIHADARAMGHPVDDAVFDGLVRAVRAFVSGETPPPVGWSAEQLAAARARAALSLARAGRGDAAFNSRAWDARAVLPAYGRAQLLEMLARTTGSDHRTRALVDDLAAAIRVEPASAALVEFDAAPWRALWYGDDLPTSAVLRGFLAAQPQHPLIPRLAAHLVKARRQGRWANTYSTAEALLSLNDYVERFETGSVGASVRLGERGLLEGALGQGGQRTSFTPMPELVAGPLRLASTGGRLYYEARLSYAMPSLPPRDEGMTLTRTYELIEGTGKQDKVSSGALMRVTLRVTTPVERYDVALVDWLPAGLEAVDTTFATTAQAPGALGDTGQPGYDADTGFDDEPSAWWSSWVFNRRELHDDRVAFYATRMPAGVHVQSYLVRATTPGDYAHPAATVEEMYAPETFGRTAASRFVVGAPKR